MDRSTVSEDEIAAMLSGSTTAAIEAAFYVVVDGFTPTELGISSSTVLEPPGVVPTFTHTPGVTDMTIEAAHLGMEDPLHLVRRQRLTWTYRITFSSTDGFAEEQTVTLNASVSSPTASASDSAVIYLVKEPNPYQIDGETTWLSTDLRIFRMRNEDSKFGVTINNNPTTFITQVINNLNAGTAGGQTFEDDIPTEQQESWLELSESVDEVPYYNFAVAKVRYRSLATTAEDVRVFFRLFPYSSTSLEYNQSTNYRRGGEAGVTIPLLGIQGGNTTTSIPCFAAPRIDSASVSMTTQTDPENVQTIPPDASGAEVVRYYGCWLDLNQTQPQFPLTHSSESVDGPFITTPRQSIQDLVRNRHQCLVAEIAFDEAPIPPGATPGSSDKLAQRNISIVDSSNPGDFASHRIPNAFDIEPTRPQRAPDELPDELMIDWGNTPIGSLATLYLPGLNTQEILTLAVEMYRSHRLIYIDDHTLQCRTGGFTYIPIPEGGGINFAGMISVDLPPTVRDGQVFNIVVRQVTGAIREPQARVETLTHRLPPDTASTRPPMGARHILGTFQITIPVRAKEMLLEREERLLSNLRWIQRAIPSTNRWFPVFNRYVRQIADRVDAFGGSSSLVEASPSGDWKGVKTRQCTTLMFITAALLGILVFLNGILFGRLSVIIGIPVLVVLLVVGAFWIRYCRPRECRIIKTIIAGFGSGAIVLAVFILIGISFPQLVTALAASTIITGIAVLVGRLRHCL